MFSPHVAFTACVSQPASFFLQFANTFNIYHRIDVCCLCMVVFATADEGGANQSEVAHYELHWQFLRHVSSLAAGMSALLD